MPILMALALIICLTVAPRIVNAASTTLHPQADVTIWQIDPDTNHNDQWLRAHWVSPAADRILVLFDLSLVPAGSHINSATLNLYVDWMNFGFQYPRDFIAYRLTEDWTETGACWNTRGGGKGPWSTHGGTFVSSGASSVAIAYQAAFWQSWDVTTIVNDWVQGAPNYGFIVKISDEANDNAGINGYSRENTNQQSIPYLQIDYATPMAVGGEMIPINQLQVLLPWLALIAALSIISVGTLIRRRRTRNN